MKYLFIALLVLFAPWSLALGLGDATLHSALNEPLMVRIPVLGTEDITPNELKVKIASPETFKQQGVERSYIHSLLRTRVVQTGGDNYVIEVFTRQPFKEAWVNFLLDFRWPRGNIVKDINLLLDLPDKKS